MTAPLLQLEALRVTHAGAGRATPDGVTFAIDRGEAVLLLGPSGCGKSTLALAAAGLLPRAVDVALEGRVLLGGVDASTLPAGRAASLATMVFQDADAQLVTALVDDEVAFGPENLCLDAGAIDGRVAASLAAVGLDARGRDAPEVLSGGGRQRLAIAAALALDAPLLVLDEPTANLDPAGTREVYDALEPLIAAGTHGVLLIEHNLDEALRIATRVIALDGDGRVIADGSPRSVLVGQADALAAAGVWLPVGVAAARALRAAGVEVAARPLTAAELADALAASSSPGLVTGRASEDAVTPGLARDARDASDVEARAGRGTPVRSGAASAIRVSDLTVTAGVTRILHHVSFEVPAGSFTAIVGPNGAGKSTLLHAIAGVARPPRGAVHIGGDDVSRLSPRQLRARVGVVFQNPEHQFLRPRVRDELELGLDAHDPSVAARVDELLERFGLAAQADSHPFLLSGGGKRRLSVGTALVERASLLVLDEPTYGQDQARAEELLALLGELQRGGTTIVMATHDLQLVAEHASHVLVLDDGHVVAHGTVAEVFASGALDRVGLGLPPLARALRDGPIERLRGVSRVGELVDALLEPGRAGESARGYAEAAAPNWSMLTDSAICAQRSTCTSSGQASSPEAPLTNRPTLVEARAKRLAWLHRLHPLAKLAATLPLIVALFFVRDLATPLAVIAACTVLALTGARLGVRSTASILLGVPVAAAVLSVTLGLWVDPASVAHTPLLTHVGPWPLYLGGWLDGLATALRMLAIVLLAVLGGLTTSGADFVRSLVQQLRVPYRFGYAALAAFRFVPRFRGELETIRRAHRVRGLGGRGPVAWIRGHLSAVVPLIAAALRHADRVAIAMDARAFGFAERRTERHLVPWRVSDGVFAAIFIVASAAAVALVPAWSEEIAAWLSATVVR